MKAMVAAFAAVVSLVAGCGPVQLDSRYRDRDIVVDGRLGDWSDALQVVEVDGISVGVMNDGSALFVALIVEDRQVRQQIAMGGLFLWFDSGGGKVKQFGLRFPLGVEEGGGEMPRPDGTASGQKPQPPGAQNPPSALDEAAQELEVLGPSEEVWRRVGVKEIPGIEAAASRRPGPLVLEFRVPLGRTGPYGYGIGAATGALVGVGVETSHIDAEAFREKMGPPDGGPGGGPGGLPPTGGGIGGGRGGGMGGGPGGGQGPPGGGERPSAPKPIKVWTQVRLATAES